MSYQSVCLADSPNFLFLLNETSGNFTDQGSHGFTGTAHATITYSVNTGFAGQPKGITISAGGYISIPDPAGFINSTTVSWEFVLAYTSSTATSPFVMAKGFDGTSGYGIFLNPSRQLGIDLTGTSVLWASGYAMPNDGTARHYVVTLNGTTKTLYENAVQKVQNTTGSGSVGGSGSEYEIGAFKNNTTPGQQPFNGATISCVSMYPSVLSSTQVNAHFNALSSSGTGATIKSPPGQFVAAMAHERNIERKQGQGGPSGPVRGRDLSSVLRKHR